MLSEFAASEVQFDGMAAEGTTAAEAATRLAAALRGWAEAHAGCRILQLSLLPAQTAGGAAGSQLFGAMAVIAYVQSELTAGDAAQAVAAAVEEIHEAQSGSEPGETA